MNSPAFVIMGVCGCGKSTVGRLIAEKMGGRFIEGDAFHPSENVIKMSAGTPLTDKDRAVWLDALAEEISSAAGPVVVACSALKKSYRKVLRVHDQLQFVYLKGDEALLRSRLEERRDHYMPAALLDSQLAILEEPKNAITLSIQQPPEEITAEFFKRAEYNS